MSTAGAVVDDHPAARDRRVGVRPPPMSTYKAKATSRRTTCPKAPLATRVRASATSRTKRTLTPSSVPLGHRGRPRGCGARRRGQERAAFRR